MQKRITCLVLLIALTIPAVGWAKAAEHDPWGQDIQATSPIGPDADREAHPIVEASSRSPVEVPGVSLFHLFVDWILFRFSGF